MRLSFLYLDNRGRGAGNHRVAVAAEEDKVLVGQSVGLCDPAQDLVIEDDHMQDHRRL